VVHVQHFEFSIYCEFCVIFNGAFLQKSGGIGMTLLERWSEQRE